MALQGRIIQEKGKKRKKFVHRDKDGAPGQDHVENNTGRDNKGSLQGWAVLNQVRVIEVVHWLLVAFRLARFCFKKKVSIFPLKMYPGSLSPSVLSANV
jgi:hypothetical protein